MKILIVHYSLQFGKWKLQSYIFLIVNMKCFNYLQNYHSSLIHKQRQKAK